jgi:hypothetical protein
MALETQPMSVPSLEDVPFDLHPEVRDYVEHMTDLFTSHKESLSECDLNMTIPPEYIRVTADYLSQYIALPESQAIAYAFLDSEEIDTMLSVDVPAFGIVALFKDFSSVMTVVSFHDEGESTTIRFAAGISPPLDTDEERVDLLNNMRQSSKHFNEVLNTAQPHTVH